MEIDLLITEKLAPSLACWFILSHLNSLYLFLSFPCSFIFYIVLSPNRGVCGADIDITIFVFVFF